MFSVIGLEYGGEGIKHSVLLKISIRKLNKDQKLIGFYESSSFNPYSFRSIKEFIDDDYLIFKEGMRGYYLLEYHFRINNETPFPIDKVRETIE